MTKKIISFLFAGILSLTPIMLTGCAAADSEGDVIVLRVSNWEEYIDEGGWEEDEVIDLDEDVEILGENALYEDFEDWFYETYGKRVKVEYSTFGTNEELYNQLTIGDTYDLVCPSEYMIMKMMREGMLVPFSDEFKDVEDENNYYNNGLSPYIRGVFDRLEIGGEKLSKYAAGYMWGTLGYVYNPELVDKEDASHWDLILNDKYAKQVTIKDSVRDAYFAGIGIYARDEITTDEFLAQDDYYDKLDMMLNRTDEETVDAVEALLTRAKDNVYSFETDAGKADMVTGKVVANEQWSGDAVYTMDQADEDDVTLCYAVPEEGANLWFDGWVMLDKGINGDADRQFAAESFINFVSRPDNVVRNMYYIGYTSVISGGEDSTVFDYADWCYCAEEEDEEDPIVEYNLAHFFTDDEEAYDDYTIECYESQLDRQLYAQYPTQEVLDRSVVMACFDEEGNYRINRMWTNIRCFDLASLFK